VREKNIFFDLYKFSTQDMSSCVWRSCAY